MIAITTYLKTLYSFISRGLDDVERHSIVRRKDAPQLVKEEFGNTTPHAKVRCLRRVQTGAVIVATAARVCRQRAGPSKEQKKKMT
jgi:hypothetical protein